MPQCHMTTDITANVEAAAASKHLDLVKVWPESLRLERHRAQERGSCFDGGRVVDQRVVQD